MCDCNNFSSVLIRDVRPRFFYMVFVEGGTAPHVKHQTLACAEMEAARLTKQTGKASYVLRTQSVCKPVPTVEWECL